MTKGINFLKIAFLLGAVIDFLVFLQMILPQLATFFWGFEIFNNQYFFAMGMGASLMLGWTILLVWAYQKPVERRIVAPLTMLVIVGIAITNIVMVSKGLFTITQMLPSFTIQTVLLLLYGVGYLLTSSKNTIEL